MFNKLLLLVALALIGGCADTCGNTVVTRMLSPDGKHEAILFRRDCGATTGFSTQISVLKTGKSASGSGNAFVADDDHGKARTGDWGGPWAEVKWLAADHLLIRYADKSRIFDRSDDVGEVALSYQAIGR